MKSWNCSTFKPNFSKKANHTGKIDVKNTFRNGSFYGNSLFIIREIRKFHSYMAKLSFSLNLGINSKITKNHRLHLLASFEVAFM